MFNEEERRIAIARLHNEQADGLDENQTQSLWVSFKKAFTVHSTLCIIGYSCINVSVQGLSTFMPTVVRTLGQYGTIEVQLRTVPPFVVSGVWSVVISYLSWKMRKRGIWIMISIPLAIMVRGSPQNTLGPQQSLTFFCDVTGLHLLHFLDESSTSLRRLLPLLYRRRPSRTILPLLGTEQRSRAQIASHHSRVNPRIGNSRFNSLNLVLHHELRSSLSTRKRYQRRHHDCGLPHRCLPHLVCPMGEQATR